MSDFIDKNNWLRSVTEQLASEKPITIPELKFAQNFFGNQNRKVAQDVVTLLPKIKDFKIILDDRIQTIEGHEYTLKPNPSDGTVVPGVWINPRENDLPKIFVSHYANKSPDFGLRIGINSETVCESPLGATLSRVERYTEKGSLDNELRLLELPISFFQIPDIKYTGEEILSVRVLIENQDSKTHVVPKYLEDEPNFEISVSLLANERAYPNDLLVLNSISKNDDVYDVEQLGFSTSNLSKEGYDVIIKIAEDYGEKLLGKKIKIGEDTKTDNH